MASYEKYDTKQGIRWRVRWHNPRPRPGEPKQPQKPGFLTRRDAVDWYEHHVAGKRGATSATPLGDYLDRWLDGRIARRELEPQTQTSYRHAIASLRATLGAIPLRDLSAADVRDWQAANAHYAPATLATYQAVLVAALNQALDDELLYRNPASRVQAPRGGAESAYWDSQAIRAFLDATQGDLAALPFRLMLMTGMRPGEMLALAWPNVDLRRRRLTLDSHIIMERGTPVLVAGTKGNPAGRVIALPEQAAGELRDWQPHYKRLRVAAPVWYDYDLVFPRVSGDGKPAAHGATIKRLDRYSARLGLPRITPHDLRHSYATWMAELGVPDVYIQETLGHSDGAMTRHYQHASDSLSRRAAQQLDAALARDRARILRPV